MACQYLFTWVKICLLPAQLKTFYLCSGTEMQVSTCPVYLVPEIVALCMQTEVNLSFFSLLCYITLQTGIHSAKQCDFYFFFPFAELISKCFSLTLQVHTYSPSAFHPTLQL